MTNFIAIPSSIKRVRLFGELAVGDSFLYGHHLCIKSISTNFFSAFSLSFSVPLYVDEFAEVKPCEVTIGKVKDDHIGG